jgi:diadenosine tetraphosphatase ApaH/serine/threonine PP2A family protein phosphatase
MIWNSTHEPSLPAGQRIYAVGDIHGRLDLLDQILRMIEVDDGERAAAERRTLIFLGDYVDRGPDSRGVIQKLLSGAPAGFEVICLKGNHEDLLLRSMSEPMALLSWVGNGGGATLASYGVLREGRDEAPLRTSDVAEALGVAMPEGHLAFFRELELSVSFGDYFFVHAGVRPGIALTDQEELDLLYIREPFLSHRGAFGKVVVHGHTPVHEPEMRANRIGIDTGAVFTGRLTALRLEGESRGFLAT